MGLRLSELVRAHHLDPGAWERVAVILWNDAPPPKEKPELLWDTQGNHPLGASGTEPAVFRLEKARANAFGMGVTVGRTPNNDIALDDPSVSRFHAYFQQDPHSGVWHVVDVESSNGTCVEGVRLAPKRPAPLIDRCEVKFGHVAVHYFSPQAFVAYLDERVNPRGPPKQRQR